jgi:HEAT repeat protein
VREAVVTALGEIASPSSVPQLLRHATDTDEDSLVREAAVAALGSIADVAAVPALLELVGSGPPQIRRRCVAALSVFDGVEVENALLAAAEDRNPMVREAAEMVVGRAPNPASPSGSGGE